MGVFRTINGQFCACYPLGYGRLRITFSSDRDAGVAADFSGNINHASGSERECIRISGGNSCRGKSRSC
jgi:hypothetical protein